MNQELKDLQQLRAHFMEASNAYAQQHPVWWQEEHEWSIQTIDRLIEREKQNNRKTNA